MHRLSCDPVALSFEITEITRGARRSQRTRFIIVAESRAHPRSIARAKRSESIARTRGRKKNRAQIGGAIRRDSGPPAGEHLGDRRVNARGGVGGGGGGGDDEARARRRQGIARARRWIIINNPTVSGSRKRRPFSP